MLLALQASRLIGSPATSNASRMETLIEADRAASLAMWSSGFTPALRQCSDSNAILLVPDAEIVTTVILVRLDGASEHPVSGVRMSLDPLGLRISNDSSLGVTWGVTMGVRDATHPVTGRYLAVWRHAASGWRIAACAFLGITPPTAVNWRELPRTVPGTDPDAGAQRFFLADRSFARTAADSGAGYAFRTRAAPDATILGRRGFLIAGPEVIGKAVDGPSHWTWDPVAGGGSAAGDLGWTVGEALITPAEGPPLKTKYLTVWQVGADGSTRFTLDAGNPRP